MGYARTEETYIDMLDSTIKDVDGCIETYKMATDKKNKKEFYYIGERDEDVIATALEYRRQMTELQDDIKNGKYTDKEKLHADALKLRNEFCKFAEDVMQIHGIG